MQSIQNNNGVTLDDDDLDAEEQQYRRTMVERSISKGPASDLKRMLTAMIVSPYTCSVVRSNDRICRRRSRLSREA